MGSRIIQGNKRLQAGICFEKHNRLYFNFFFIDMYDIEKRFLTEMLKLKFTKKKKNDGYLPEQEFWAFELE